MKNRVFQKVIVYVISLSIVCAVAGIFLFVKNKQEEQGMEELYSQEEELQEAKPVMTQDEMEALYDEHKENRVNGDSENTDTVNTESCPVDFEGIWEINKDVYAWITVPGTAIDYPVLQHETDNTYYLNYNIDGSYGYPGCIYTENMNSKDFMDNNTIIYGHNMKDGTMFAALHKFEDASFFEEYDKVYIYTPEEELNYTIFAAYVYDDRHLMYSFDFADEAVYATYLEDIQGMRDMNANLRSDITVTSEDKIITLVTCIANQPDKRLLVQAVLERESKE